MLYRSFALAICFVHGNVYTSILLSQLVLPSPSLLCPQVCSLCLNLYSCPANRFIGTMILAFLFKIILTCWILCQIYIATFLGMHKINICKLQMRMQKMRRHIQLFLQLEIRKKIKWLLYSSFSLSCASPCPLCPLPRVLRKCNISWGLWNVSVMATVIHNLICPGSLASMMDYDNCTFKGFPKVTQCVLMFNSPTHLWGGEGSFY